MFNIFALAAFSGLWTRMPSFVITFLTRFQLLDLVIAIATLVEAASTGLRTEEALQEVLQEDPVEEEEAGSRLARSRNKKVSNQVPIAQVSKT